MNLLSGPVVFVDDELANPGSTASQLLDDIRATGRPVVAAEDLPDDPEAWFEHWKSLAFVVLDWDLSPGSTGGLGGSTLSEYKRTELYDFVSALMKRIFCPIFIISAENTAEIRNRILADMKFLDQSNNLDARIAIFPKDVLMSDIVDYLTQWVAASPALSALKAWSQEHDEARNRLFLDMHELAADWPVYVWRTAENDSVDAGHELSTVISTNLLNRIEPIAFGSAISTYAGAVSGASMRRVSQGRTVVPSNRLSDRMVFPGDIFAFPGTGELDVWMNISPVCQTVSRDGREVLLHLLHGNREAMPTKKAEFNTLNSKVRGPNGTLIHTLVDEHPYYFAFGDAQIIPWKYVRSTRIGRLLPPFVTRVQQMHASYIQSEGLPSVYPALYDIA